MEDNVLEKVKGKLESDHADILQEYEREDELVQKSTIEQRRRFHELSRSMLWAKLEYINRLKGFIEKIG